MPANGETIAAGDPTCPTKSSNKTRLPSGWQIRHAPGGHHFYVNHEIGARTWVKPGETVESESEHDLSKEKGSVMVDGDQHVGEVREKNHQAKETEVLLATIEDVKGESRLLQRTVKKVEAEVVQLKDAFQAAEKANDALHQEQSGLLEERRETIEKLLDEKEFLRSMLAKSEDAHNDILTSENLALDLVELEKSQLETEKSELEAELAVAKQHLEDTKSLAHDRLVSMQKLQEEHAKYVQESAKERQQAEPQLHAAVSDAQKIKADFDQAKKDWDLEFIDLLHRLTQSSTATTLYYNEAVALQKTVDKLRDKIDSLEIVMQPVPAHGAGVHCEDAAETSPQTANSTHFETVHKTVARTGMQAYDKVEVREPQESSTILLDRGQATVTDVEQKEVGGEGQSKTRCQAETKQYEARIQELESIVDEKEDIIEELEDDKKTLIAISREHVGETANCEAQHQAEKRWYETLLKELESTIDSKEKAIKDLKDDKEILMAMFQCQAEHSGKEHEEQLAGLQTTLASNKDAIKDLKDDKTMLMAMFQDEAERSGKEHDTQLATLKSTIVVKEKTIKVLQDDREMLRAMLDTADKFKAQAECSHKAYEEQITDLKATVASKQEAITHLSHEQEMLKATVQTAEESKGQAEGTRKEQQGQIANLNAKVVEKDASIAEFSDLACRLQQKVAELTSKLLAAEQQITDGEQDIADMEARLDRMRGDLDHDAARGDHYESLHASVNKDLTGARQQICDLQYQLTASKLHLSEVREQLACAYATGTESAKSCKFLEDKTVNLVQEMATLKVNAGHAHARTAKLEDEIKQREKKNESLYWEILSRKVSEDHARTYTTQLEDEVTELKKRIDDHQPSVSSDLAEDEEEDEYEIV